MESNKKKKSNILKIIAVIILTFIVFFIITVVFIYQSIDYSFDEDLFLSARSSGTTTIYYNSSKDNDHYTPMLYEELNSGAYRKLWRPYAEISDSLKNSFIAMEDRDFWSHSGVNVKRSILALLNHIFHFKTGFGGSTITQQVIKNISGDNERTVKRKMNEIFRAIHMEKDHSKEEIFEIYLNIVNLSENILGVGEAAETYFGKSVGELDYKEAAVIVGIANAPERYNPYRNPEACKKKRNRVLYSLWQCGFIDENYYEKAKNEDLGVLPRSEENRRFNSWFTETVINDVAIDLSIERNISKSLAMKYLINGGFKIYSTVSPEIQTVLDDYFKNTENFPKQIDDGLEYSMVVSDPKSGNLLATIGSVGEKRGNRLLNYANVKITPGSTLKPLALYAPLLDSGRINWASVFDDVPLEFKQNDTEEWKMFPQNYPAVYDGLITLKDALRLSKNTVAVNLYKMLGAERIYLSLKNNFGFNSLVKKKVLDDGKVLSDLSASPLALGQLTDGLTLRELTEAYNVFPNDGNLKKGRSYLFVYDIHGDRVLEKEDSEKEIFKAETARIMNKLLEGVVDEGTAKRITLSEITDTAGKTGTSGNDKDRIFIGYTPQLTAGIWCGYSGQKRSISQLSVSHLEIWDQVMHEIYIKTNLGESFFSTEGLLRLPYCMDSGEMYGDICMYDIRGSRMEYGFFTEDSKPNAICKRHILCKYDISSEGVAGENCPECDLCDIALIKVETRNFPCEVIITDAEYVWRNTKDVNAYPNDYTVPYFYNTIPPDEYVGKSKNKKQFNSGCYIH